ncbi:MAG: SUMF1/EgtB/PvdO family nonheme iron enzyme [Chloroflexota bacterium]
MTVSQKGRIFISYRRVDSGGYAGRIYDRLAARFGEDAVFMDVDDIPAGLDFVEVLQNAVQSCDALAALIGRNWLDARDEAGGRRLDNPEDFVRVEIAAALERGIRVIPVLVDGAPIPRASDLPENLKPLARRNAVQVNHHSFNADAYHLIEQLELALKAAEDSKLLKARVLQEEQERKRVESREQAERTRLAAEEKARKEKEAREKKQAEEKARKDALKKARQQETTERIKKIFRTGSKRPYFIGGGIVILFLLGYLIKNTFLPYMPSPPTGTSTTLALSSTASTKIPSTPTPTSTDVPTEIPLTPTPTPGIGSTMISEKDGMVMVYVPAGEFQMGSEDGEGDEKPVHTVYLDAFWIDQTEVTNSMYVECMDAGECEDPGGIKRSNALEYPDHPVIEDWYMATAYCKWAGLRLPTEAEWEKAARGGLKDKKYPWGDDVPTCQVGANNGISSSACLDEISELTTFASNGTTEVKTFAPNGYGLYDMAGNVLEWVSDWYDGDYYSNSSSSNPMGPDSGSYHVLRGGSWNGYEESVRSSDRSEGSLANRFYNNVGFRCARDATP